ncbi:MAG: Mu-like prophage major head subunit gpT family protein [Anaerovoracaceae bacterium]
MIVDRGNLNGLYIGYKTIFNKALDLTKPLFDRVATEVPSTTGSENYAWLGSFPRLREWLGSKQVKNLSASGYTIANKDYEATISVPRNDIEDDKYGLYNPMFEDMGQAAALWPDTLVFPLLKKGFEEKCYDGKPFYAKDHKVGKLTFSNKGTAKLNQSSFLAARAAMMSVKDEEGNSLNIIPDLLVVPPALEAAAKEILEADFINGSSNITKGMADILVVPELAGEDTAWHLLCTKKAIKPLIFQKRKAPKFIKKDAENDDNVFFNKEFIYGVDARGNAGFALWQLAYGSDGSAS